MTDHRGPHCECIKLEAEVDRLQLAIADSHVMLDEHEAEIERLRSALERLYKTYLPEHPSETDIQMSRHIVAAVLDQPDPTST